VDKFDGSSVGFHPPARSNSIWADEGHFTGPSLNHPLIFSRVISMQ
jgi:hypothetical protein